MQLVSVCRCYRAKVNRSWELGLTACLFWTGSDVFLSTTSIMHLCAIAIHRHLGIAYPLRMRRGAQNRRHVLCLLLPAWTVSAAVSASLVVEGAGDRRSVLVPLDGRPDKTACGIYDHTFAIYSSMLPFFHSIRRETVAAMSVSSVIYVVSSGTLNRKDVNDDVTELSRSIQEARDLDKPRDRSSSNPSLDACW